MLLQAQEMLKNVQNQQQQQITSSSSTKISPSRPLTVTTGGNNVVGEDGSRPLSAKMTSPPLPPLEGRTSRSSYVMVDKIHSRTNSTSSLNVIDDKDAHESRPSGGGGGGVGVTESEVEQLRDENELLTIKVNKLKYDLKLRDTTVDDLKVFIRFDVF